MLGQVIFHVKKNETPFLTPHKKYYIFVRDLNVKNKTLKLQWENILMFSG